MIQEIKKGPGLPVIWCTMNLVSAMKCTRALWLNFNISCDEEYRQYRHQEFQFNLGALWNIKWAPILEWQSYLYFLYANILVLFGSKFQYSRKRRQVKEGKPSHTAAIRELVLTFCPTMRCCLQRKLKPFVHVRRPRSVLLPIHHRTTKTVAWS